jgi:hypothetical protein
MRQLFKQLSLTYAAGTLGALMNSLAVWIFGAAGIAAALGVHIAPPLTKAFLYPRLVWGGLWGFLFLISWLRHAPLLRGILFSLPPTLVQLLVVFPYALGKGFMGLQLGTLTPLFVVLFNAIWGIVAAYWLYLTEDRWER